MTCIPRQCARRIGLICLNLISTSEIISYTFRRDSCHHKTSSMVTIGKTPIKKYETHDNNSEEASLLHTDKGRLSQQRA